MKINNLKKKIGQGFTFVFFFKRRNQKQLDFKAGAICRN